MKYYLWWMMTRKHSLTQYYENGCFFLFVSVSVLFVFLFAIEAMALYFNRSKLDIQFAEV